MVKWIRSVEQALVSPLKRPSKAEVPNIEIARRSLVAAVPIDAGQQVTAEMLSWKRPGNGLSPMSLWDVLGRPANRSYKADEVLDP